MTTSWVAANTMDDKETGNIHDGVLKLRCMCAALQEPLPGVGGQGSGSHIPLALYIFVPEAFTLFARLGLWKFIGAGPP